MLPQKKIYLLSYAIFCFAGIKTLFELPYCFKNASDADKAIEDNAHATHACISVYKKEKVFNSKGKYAKRQKNHKVDPLFQYAD